VDFVKVAHRDEEDVEEDAIILTQWRQNED
jgi:hypothetical protein